MGQAQSTVRIAEAQIGEAAQALARAFFDDPLQRYILPDAGERERLSPPVFERFIRYGHLFGEVHTTPDRAQAAAVWLPPGETEMTPERMEEAGILELPEIIGDGFDRFGSVMDFLDPFHKRDAAGPHWYLAVLGVDVPMQGKGVGGALVQQVVRKADLAGLPCYLETANAKNVPFYVNQGFKVVVDTVDPVSGLQLWTFLREPA